MTDRSRVALAHRRRFLQSVSAGSLLLPWWFTQERAAWGEDSPEPLGTALETLRDRHGLPGLMAGHFTLSGGFEVESVGLRKASLTDALDRRDRMHLGSCTKSMTATLVGIAVDEGKLSFDSTLASLFPDDPAVTGSVWADVTVDDLMRHTSGAPANPPWARFAGTEGDRIALRREILHWWMKRKRPQAAIGRFVYSNLGYVALGCILEQLRGHTWEQEIRQRLFDPLGMDSAGFGPPTRATDGQAPWGHQQLLGMLIANEIDNPPALGPAGTVHASMEDWVRYLRVHLMDDPARDGVLPLSQKTLRHLHTPRAGEEYAGGWICGERSWAGGTILNHNGSNTHWYCVVFLAPQQQRGIFAASNFGLAAAGPCDEALQEVLKRFPANTAPERN